MADRTPTRSQRAGSAKPYERPSPSLASTPKQDQGKGGQGGDRGRGDAPGGLLRSVFQAIASPFRSTSKRQTIPSSPSTSNTIDLESGAYRDVSSEPSKQSISESNPRVKNAGPRSESRKMLSERERSGKFSAAQAFQSDTESEAERDDAARSADRDMDMDENMDRKLSPKRGVQSGHYALNEADTPRRGSKRGRGQSPSQTSKYNSSKGLSGTSEVWEIVTDPSRTITFEEYITLVADFKNGHAGRELTEVETSALKDLYERVGEASTFGGKLGMGRGMSPASGISRSGRGLFGSPITQERESQLSRSRSANFASNGLPSPSTSHSAFNTPTRRSGVGTTSTSSIPFPSARSGLSGLPHNNDDSPSSTPASPATTLSGRKILGTPRRMAQMRTYAGPGRSSLGGGEAGLSGSASNSTLSPLAKAGENNDQRDERGHLGGSRLGASRSSLGETTEDITMQDGDASNAQSSASKSAKKPQRTQAATELLSMIDSMNAESAQKTLAVSIVNPYEGGCFNIGSSQALPGPSGVFANNVNGKKKRARLSLKSQGKAAGDAAPVEERESGTAREAEPSRKVRMTDMELIEEADRVQKRSRPNASEANSEVSKKEAEIPLIPKSTFIFDRPATVTSADATAFKIPLPQPTPAHALLGSNSSSPSMADLLPKRSADAPATRTSVTFAPTHLGIFEFGAASKAASQPSPSTLAPSAIPTALSAKAQIIEMDVAALPIFTFVALAHCDDLGDGRSVIAKQVVMNLNPSDLPQNIFAALAGASTKDLSLSPREDPMPPPAAPALDAPPAPAFSGFTGWGPNAAAKTPGGAGPKWECPTCACTWPKDKALCGSCETPRPA